MVYITFEIPRIVNAKQPPLSNHWTIGCNLPGGWSAWSRMQPFVLDKSLLTCEYIAHIAMTSTCFWNTDSWGMLLCNLVQKPTSISSFPVMAFHPWGKEWVWSDTVGLLRDRTGDIHVALARTFHRGNRWGELIAGWMLPSQLGMLSNLGFLDKNWPLIGWLMKDGCWGLFKNRRRTTYY